MLRFRPFLPAFFSGWLFCLGFAGAGSAAADSPRNPRLAAGPDGSLFGGWQARAGGDGDFELFAVDPKGEISGLGRFGGNLAGLAIAPGNRRLVLTRDGSLASHGDELVQLAIPDARWNMLDLAWLFGEAAALHHDRDGGLWLVRPEAPDSWRLEGEKPLVRDAQLDRAVLAVLADGPHLVWSARADDLSRGAFRHLAGDASGWRELPPMPLGDPGPFTVFPREGTLELAAIIPEPLGRRPPRLALRSWRDGRWTTGLELPEGLTRSLAGSRDLAGAATGIESRWLAADFGGVFLDGRPLTTAPKPEYPWSGLATLFTLFFFLVLLILHCRRSRQLSRLFPGRPVDLTSRGAALILDWLTVSLMTAAYHFSSGNVRIYAEWLNLTDLNSLFWFSLAVFSLYELAFEAHGGATPGKRLAGIRVRSALGGPPSFRQALLRNLLRGVDMFPVFFPGLVGAIIALFNPNRQRLGDLAAATVLRRHFPVEGRRFVLASASPRRRELLAALGVDFRVAPADVDEKVPAGSDPEETVRRLALAKARKAAAGLDGGAGEVVVAADTLVALDGEVFGKPGDAAEAAEMLSRLSGRSHQVLTGVAVLDTATGQGVSEVESTEVELRTLSPGEISSYVASGDPLDKAGAYGVQSGFLVKQVRGSLSNVMGLPMETLRSLFAALDS
ncbi:MAG: Maf family nucleotide pyrophosphatase [Planctomycetota bacterium]|jgi:septum formation protein|nr:Maf family nucleotide pyrophosphatase [Planctomycetota bacterium]